ncbi:MAG TPA: alpha/beta hydrolase [Candidatus Limnocylindria bacterium]|nr:alpha/beta hydrolase [Candidatus Limnocylindria bacterium]
MVIRKQGPTRWLGFALTLLLCGCGTAAPAATPTPTSRSGGGSHLQVSNNLVFTRVVDCGVEQCELKLDLVRPDDATSGLPLVVLLPGSPAGPGHRAYLTAFQHALAKVGVLVANVDYRAGDNDGQFPVPIDDVGCAVAYVRSVAADHGGDPSRIVLVGHSLGGYVALMVALGAAAGADDCLASESPDVSAVLSVEGESGPDAEIADFWQWLIGGTAEELPDRYAAADSSRYAANNPELIIRALQGDDGGRLTPVAGAPFQPFADAGHDSLGQPLINADHFDGVEVNQAADQTINYILQVIDLLD